MEIKDRRSKIPRYLAILTFVVGLVNIYSAFFIHIRIQGHIMPTLLPLRVVYTSHTIVILSGIFLVFLSKALWEQKYRAWLAATVLLLITLGIHILRALNIFEIGITVLNLTLLWVFRFNFRVKSIKLNKLQRIKSALLVLTVVFVYSVLGFFFLQGQFSRPVTWANIARDYQYTALGIGNNTLIPITNRAEWFEDSLAAVIVILIVLAMAIMFGPDLFKQDITEEQLSFVRASLKKYGYHPVSYLSLMDDKQYYFSEDNRGFIAYKIKSGTAIALGDPVGSQDFTRDLAEKFYLKMQQHGLSVAFYLASDTDIYKLMGLKLLKVGNDAIIPLGAFDINTPELKNVRNSVAKIEREHISFVWNNASDVPWSTMSTAQELYAEWKQSQGNRTLTFSTGFYPFPPDEEIYILTAWQNNMLFGLFTFFPYNQGKGAALDLMIKNASAPNGIVEASFVAAINYFKSNGLQELSLGLAATESDTFIADSPIAQKAVNALYKNANQWYHYRSLAAFKQKFNPQWQGRFLAYSSDMELPKVSLALLQAHTGN